MHFNYDAKKREEIDDWFACDSEKTNPIQSQTKPISSKSALVLPQVSAGEWLRNDNFVFGFIVPVESAKMARKLALGNLLEGGRKKAKFL